jgi:O-antigen/teichoic acid export membrane protein
MSEQRGPSDSPATVQRGLLFTSSGAVVNIAFLLVEAMIAARLVSPDGFGIYTLLVALVNFLVVAIDLGGKTAVTQMLASSGGARQSAIASNALALRLLVCAAMSALVWLAQGPLTALDSTPGLVRYLGYLPPMLVAMSLDELFSGMLQCFQA